VDKKLNFARYPEMVQTYQTRFLPEGMKGAQEFWEVKEKSAFYGDTLEPITEWEKQNVFFSKRIVKPMIFRQARTIMDTLQQ